MGYKQASFCQAYYSVLSEGLTVTKASVLPLAPDTVTSPPHSQAALNHQIPRKTLEYYVKGKATLESYQKMGLPHPEQLLAVGPLLLEQAT